MFGSTFFDGIICMLGVISTAEIVTMGKGLSLCKKMHPPKKNHTHTQENTINLCLNMLNGT